MADQGHAGRVLLGHTRTKCQQPRAEYFDAPNRILGAKQSPHLPDLTIAMPSAVHHLLRL